ncbi:hypothetical protein D7Y21_13520 [Corallococcus sp. AB045]|nr:hypothetical protein D7Y21_13520 [Corallococcus sp. AB045]
MKCFLAAVVLFAVACGGSSVPSTPVLRDGEGLLELPLVSTTAAGRSYKLVGATFTLTGPQSTTITDTTADTVSVPLIAGDYTLQLTGTWHIERTDQPGVTVPSTLVSPNPLVFTLGEGETRPVRFLFKVPGDGNADVGFRVDHGGWVSGTLHFFDRTPSPNGPPDIFAELSGKTVPFVISFESSTVTRSSDSYSNQVVVQTSPVTLQFGGAPTQVLQKRIIPALEGQPLNIVLGTSAPGQSYAQPIVLENPASGTTLRLDLYLYDLGVGPDGYPQLEPFSFSDGHAEISTYWGSIPANISDGVVAPQ